MAVVVAAAVVAVIASAWVAEVRLSPLLDPDAHDMVVRFARGLVPADLSPGFLRVVALAAVRTVMIAVAGTVLSLGIAIPLGILGTRTLFRAGPLIDRERRSAAGRVLAWLSSAARAVLGALRAVPDLVWAMVFVVGVGLGPVPGVLALAVSYGGVLGRVLADLFEDVDPRPLEALRTTGASRAQVFVFGIWPQAQPGAIAYTLYSFECGVRAAAVAGLVGAGGIGYEIALSMRLFEYGQIVTLIGALLAVMWLTEAAGTALRRVLRANAPAGVLAHRRLRLDRAAAAASSSRGSPLAVPSAGAVLALGATLVAAWVYRDLIDAKTARGMGRFAGALFSPDLAPGYLATLFRPVAQTIATSVIGTLIGVVLGALLGIPAIAQAPDDDRARGAAWLVGLALRRVCRAALAVLRAVPDTLWVLVFILAVGLGPFAGTLALGVHTGGVLGKLYADTFEEVSPLPLRGLRATGASPLQILVWGGWPEARRMLISYTVLRWEMNLRASTIVGVAGGGGIGLELYNKLQLGFYPQVATITLIVGVLIAATSAIGDAIRRELEASPGVAHRRRNPPAC
jgi:phosphonate transport system permease protein